MFIVLFLGSWQFSVDNERFSGDWRSLQAAPSDRDQLIRDLLEAISGRDTDKAKKAIAQGVDVNATFNFTAYNFI